MFLYIFYHICDILIATETKEGYLEVLESVLLALQRVNLKLKAQKCVLMKEKVPFLGREVSGYDVHADPGKVEKI